MQKLSFLIFIILQFNRVRQEKMKNVYCVTFFDIANQIWHILNVTFLITNITLTIYL